MSKRKIKDIVVENNLNFKLHHETREATVVGYQGHDEEVISIPETVSGYKVTAIADNAFEGHEWLNVVILPPTLERIGMYAFSNSSVEEVLIKSDNATLRIGECAFSHCSLLKTVQLPNKTFLEGTCTFSECSNLKDIDSYHIKSDIFSCTFLKCYALKSFIINHPMRISKDAFDGVELERLSAREDFQFHPNFLKSIQNAQIECSKTSCLADLAYEGFRINTV